MALEYAYGMNTSIAQYTLVQYIDQSSQIVLNMFVRKRRKQKMCKDK